MSRDDEHIPDRFIPNEEKVLGDEYSLLPEKWDCPNLIHACHKCGFLSRGLGGHMRHLATSHPTSKESPRNTCSALPADSHWWPRHGQSVVRDLQDSLSNGKGAPNELADIIE